MKRISAICLLVVFSMISGCLPMFVQPSLSTATPAPTATPTMILTPPTPIYVGCAYNRDDAQAYNFTATVTDAAGQVYNLQEMHTLSAIPLPPEASHLARYAVLFWLTEERSLSPGPSPTRHIWFSQIKSLQRIVKGPYSWRFEIQANSNQVFQFTNWMSNIGYSTEFYDHSGEQIIGLIGDKQVCIPVEAINEITFTTSQEEIDRFEHDVLTIFPPHPATLHFQQDDIFTERFFILDGWYIGGRVGDAGGTRFCYPISSDNTWCGPIPSGDPWLPIFQEDGSNRDDFWNLPNTQIPLNQISSIKFGNCPNLIRVSIELQNSNKIQGYLRLYGYNVSSPEWGTARKGFWDWILSVSLTGIDAYDMFVDRCLGDDFLPYPGQLEEIEFKD